jgi:N-acetylglucosamine kinase-like BadF-type ATPase
MVLGVEGGGTQTRIVSRGPEGLLDFRSFATSIKYRDVGVNEAITRLAAIVEEHYSGVRAIAIAVAGATDESARREFISGLADRLSLPSSRVHVESDTTLTLRSAEGEDPKIVLISGTGSVCIASDEAGHVIQTGGWGSVIGDEGSGRTIGREALAHLARVLDGRERATRLSAAIQARIALDADDLREYLKSTELRVADFAQVVLETPSDRSSEILEQASYELAKLIQGVLLRFAGHTVRPSTLYLSGSIAKHAEIAKRLKVLLPLMSQVTIAEDTPAKTLLEIATSLS